MAAKQYIPPYETRGTRKDIKSPAQLSCEAKGGIWDEASQTCVLQNFDLTKGLLNQSPKQTAPEPIIPKNFMNLPKGEGTPSPTMQQEQPMPKAKLTKPEIITNEEGEPTGIILPDGRKFVGIPKSEVEMLYNKWVGKTSLPQGALTAGTQQRAAERQQRIQQLTQMAQQGLLTQDELMAIQGAEPSFTQAAQAGAIGILPGLVGGAVGGAAIGAAAGGGVGAIPGAIIGGIGGTVTAFIIGAKNSLKGQQTQEFAGDKLALTKGQTYLRALITDTNKYPEHAPENIAAFYKTLSLIDIAHAKTARDANEDLNKALGTDGFEKLAAFRVFDNTMRDYYVNAFNAALTSPNPNAMLLTNEELGIETNEENL